MKIQFKFFNWTFLRSAAFFCPLANQFLPSSIAVLGLYGTMFILACLCFVGAILIIIYVPETKNKSIEEIQEIMAKWIARFSSAR